MNLMTIVRGDVLVRNIGTSEQRTRLLNEALQAKEFYGSKFSSNEGCWRSNFNYTNIDWLVDEIKFSLNHLVGFYMQEDKAYQHRFAPSINTIDHWTNINDPKSCNRLHVHRSYDYAACYYIQAEGTGEITFHNPANLMAECSPNSAFTSRITYQPRDGDLLVWPAWLPHEVEVNNSDKQRVNIAFNIKI